MVLLFKTTKKLPFLGRMTRHKCGLLLKHKPHSWWRSMDINRLKPVFTRVCLQTYDVEGWVGHLPSPSKCRSSRVFLSWIKSSQTGMNVFYCNTILLECSREFYCPCLFYDHGHYTLACWLDVVWMKGHKNGLYSILGVIYIFAACNRDK